MERKTVTDCNASTCQYHVLTENVINDLKVAVEKTAEGQHQLKETVIQLAEAFKVMERIEGRIEKLEDQRVLKDKEQDTKIDELRIFMYKAIGAGMALTGALSVILKFAGVLLI